MKKMVAILFAICLFTMTGTMLAMAAETSQHVWQETTSGVWQVKDVKNNTFVKNAIIKETFTTAGPGITTTVYYVVVENSQMATEDGTYFGVPVTINRNHDGTYGRIITGAEELVAANPDKIVDMSTKYDDGVTVGVAPGETSTAATSAGPGVTTSSYIMTYEEAAAIEWPEYAFGTRFVRSKTNPNLWSITCNGTYHGDRVNVWRENDYVELHYEVRTPPESADTKPYPTIQDILEALEKLH